MSSSIKDEILRYAKDIYGTEPDHPFSDTPDCAVLRHVDTRKWYALFMEVSRSVLHLGGEGRVWIMNIKCDPILSGSLRMQQGYLPAYHMNHDLWLTVMLDGTVPAEDITPLLDLSFELTMKKQKRNR